MTSRTILASSISLLLLTAAIAEAGERPRSWCRHEADRNDPMLWSEGFGVASCNDRAETPYRPWRSAIPVRKDRDDPMTARDDWRVGDFSDYDHRYDDRYDRRSHKYR
jgi:hypothetical protein